MTTRKHKRSRNSLHLPLRTMLLFRQLIPIRTDLRLPRYKFMDFGRESGNRAIDDAVLAEAQALIESVISPPH